MVKISTAPLSVNECWRGRRFKTDKYKGYEKLLLLSLPQIKLPKPPYHLIYDFGFSNSLSDIDNPVKPMTDILQKKYGFNDKSIAVLTVRKHIVDKGLEYISFEILHAE